MAEQKNKEEFVGTSSKECNSLTTYIDYKAKIKKRQDEERKRKEKWSKELKQSMNTNNNNYTYASSIGHLSGGYTSGTISTTSISDSKITIDCGANGSMRVDVPLIANGRDVMKELDEMRDALLLLTHDFNLEEQYPELKQAYDDYMDLHRSIKLADKLAKTGDT